MDERERMRHLAVNLRLEAEQIARRRWQALADHTLTPAECDSLEQSRWACMQKAAEVERTLRELPPL